MTANGDLLLAFLGAIAAVVSIATLALSSRQVLESTKRALSALVASAGHLDTSIGLTKLLIEQIADSAEDGKINEKESRNLKKLSKDLANELDQANQENQALVSEVTAYRKKLIFLDQIVSRLKKHNESLGVMSWLNLVIGIIFSTFGIVLIYFSQAETDTSNWIENIKLSQLFSGIFINAIALFFLRLYSKNRDLISTNQREISTIELIKSSLLYANELDDPIAKLLVLSRLSQAERSNNTPNNTGKETGASADLAEFVETLKKVRDLAS